MDTMDINGAAATKAKRRFSFSGLVLWGLDAVFLFVIFAIVAFVAYSDLNGGFGLSLDLYGHEVQRFGEVVFAHIVLACIISFIWAIHLVIASARHGDPFTKRNVYILNTLGIVSVVLSFTNNGLTLGTSGAYMSHPPQGLSEWLSGGFMWGLCILAIAAVFNKGVELRQEELRLRQEQALTV